MPTTTCPKCGRCYEETSEEEANAPSRRCSTCWHEQHTADERHAIDEAYALVGKLRDEVEELDGDDDSDEAELTRSRYYAAIDAYDKAILSAVRKPTPIPPELGAFVDAARARVDALTKGMAIPAKMLRQVAVSKRLGWGESPIAKLAPIFRAMAALEAPIEPLPAPPSRTPILDSLPEELRRSALATAAACGDGPLDVEHALRQLKQATEKPLTGEDLKAVLDFLNSIPEGTMSHYDQTKQTIADADNAARTSSGDRLTAELVALRGLLGQIALNMAAIADRLDAAASMERPHG